MYYYAKARQQIGFNRKKFHSRDIIILTIIKKDNKGVHINKHYKYNKVFKQWTIGSLGSNFRDSSLKRLPCPMILILLNITSDSTSSFWWGDFHDRMAFFVISSLIWAIFYKFSTRITPIKSKPSFADFQLGFLLFLFFSFFHFIFIFFFILLFFFIIV